MFRFAFVLPIYLRSLRGWFIFSVLLLGTTSHCLAQEFWTGITLRAKLTKAISADVEQQVRFEETIGRYKSTFTEAGVRIRPWKHLGAVVSYRFTDRLGSRRADDNDRHRWSGDLFYLIGSSKTQWQFTHRIRYQSSRELEEGVKEWKNYLRNRFEIAYNLTKRVQPYASYENFYRFDTKDEVRLHRITLGLETTIGKNLGVEAFYRVEKDANVKYPETAYIIGIMGTYRLSFQKKDSEEINEIVPIR